VGLTYLPLKRDQEWRLAFGAALNDYCGESASVSGIRTSGKREEVVLVTHLHALGAVEAEAT
jgi:hypothetical protein